MKKYDYLLAVIIFVGFFSGRLHAQAFCRMPPPGPPGPINEKTLAALQGYQFPESISKPGDLIQKGQARGTWETLIILIDFPDYRWNHQADSNFVNTDTIYTTEHFNEMLFSLGTYRDLSGTSAFTGSMRDFYLENSYGQFEVTGATTLWYTAAQNLASYANNSAGFGGGSVQLVEEAVALAGPDVDFSQFDNNGDGTVDGLFVVHAGPAAEEIYTTNFPEHENYLWSHKSSIATVQIDGVRVRGYTLEPQNGTIGVFSHEFGHELGLPDLYDTDGSSEGIGEWGLMGAGGWCHKSGDPLGTSPAHFTPWSKENLGWLTPIIVTRNMLDVVIHPVEQSPVAYRIWRNGDAGPEYFLVENRQNIGFDSGLTRRQKDFGLPDANGLIIYHVDGFGFQSNENRRRVDVEEASPFFSNSTPVEQLDLQRILPTHEFLFNGNRGDNGDPFPGFSRIDNDSRDYIGFRDLDTFDGSSIPNSHDNSGAPTSVSISNIRFDGQNMFVDFFISPVTSVTEASSLPTVFTLNQNYPNPFNPETVIQYEIPGSILPGQRLIIDIFNIAGERVVRLVDTAGSPGRFSVRWNGADQHGRQVPSGVYIYRLRAGDRSQSRKMLLLR